MKPALTFSLLAAFAFAACSGGPKGEGPARDDGGFVPHNGGDGGYWPSGDGGYWPSGDGGYAPSGDGGSSGGGDVYCGPVDSSECGCGSMPASGRTLNASCGPGQVGSPSLCCATPAWPGATPSGWIDIGCVCSQIFCEKDTSGVCQCGFAAPSQGDTPVSSCTGASCCRSRSTLAPTCACYDQSIGCLDGDEPVPSCAPSDLRCSDQTPSACH
jgi:hypothetical protein